MDHHGNTFGVSIAGNIISYCLLFMSLANVEATLRVTGLLLSIVASIYIIRKNRK